MRKIVAAKESMVVVTEKKSNVKPILSFRGRDLWKFSYSKGDERIERNITTEVKEHARETTSMTVKNKKNGELMKFGRPARSLPPGMV
jgi:hypothetical protein